MSEVRLQVKNLCKSFGITKAVQNVSFNVNKGEVHALIGENGSGKSTLTNMLTGIYSIGSGTFILDGKEIHPKNQVEANNEGVSIIVQELGTLSGLTVAENIFLGHEEQFVHFGIKNTKAMNRKATELLKKYGFDRIKASDIIDNYNFEDRKLVEIVKATYFDPKIVVVDETTTALSQEGRDELYKHMDRIRNSGNSVIFISHDLPEVLEKSDTITILRDGIYIDTVKSADVTEDDLKRLMVGREVTGDYYRADYGEKVSDEVVLSVKNVTVPGIISDISFDLHKGEMLGFGGLSESGMHEVGKAIFGASYDREGTVTLADGTQINDIPTAIKHSIAYTSKDRDNESVATMIAEGGIYIEDYSDIEEQVEQIAHVDLIEQELLDKPRDTVIIHMYLEPGASPVETLALIAARMEAAGIPYTSETEGVEQEDWQNGWRKYYHPMDVGQRLAIVPSWQDYDTDRVKLILDPGLAFGTGGHETTNLCLEVLDERVKGGERVLDIGTGSGILAIAALKLGAAVAEGVDIDPVAVRTAGENAALNGVADKLTVLVGDLSDKASGKYDIITANIVANAIMSLAPAVPGLMADDAVFIASGIIDSRKDEVIAALEAAGLAVLEVKEKRGWECIVCKKA